MPAAKTRTIVGRPMTPELLVRTGGLGALPETPADFDPAGEWVNKYRIHTCHGYIESGNEDVGLLRLERSLPDTGGGFLLKVRRRVVSSEGQATVIDAWIRAAADVVGSLMEWRLTSTHEDITGKVMPGLSLDESGRIENGNIVVKRGGSSRSRPRSRLLAADWSLFEAVQRLDDSAKLPAAFDVLEELDVMREDQRWVRRGLYRMAGWPAPRWLAQTGHGLLPWEYWLDERGRLLMAATGPRAYVLDDNADDLVNKRLAGIRARKARRRDG